MYRQEIKKKESELKMKADEIMNVEKRMELKIRRITQLEEEVAQLAQDLTDGEETDGEETDGNDSGVSESVDEKDWKEKEGLGTPKSSFLNF